MSDWDASSGDEAAPPAPVVPQTKVATTQSKWEGEDEAENGVASDWDESSDEDKPKPTSATLAPPKKKGTLKAKLAQKEVERAERLARGELSEDEMVEMHPQEKRRLEKEREIESDLKNAADLFSGSSISKTSSSGAVQEMLEMNPKTKEEFARLSALIVEVVLKKHEAKPLYHSFVEQHVRDLAMPLKDVEVRKAASALTTLANEKQKEAKDKTSGKKKPKAGGKSQLGAAKVVGKIDTNAYSEALDDFGNDPNDFM